MTAKHDPWGVAAIREETEALCRTMERLTIASLIEKADSIEAAVSTATTQDERDEMLRKASAAWKAVCDAEDALAAK